MLKGSLGRLGFACAFMASVALGSPALAEEGVAFKNLLGSIGLIPKDKDPIRYRERAPLVVPPKAELPPPASGSLARANPQWPKDPDVMERRRRAEAERQPVTWSEVRRMAGENPRLSPSELAAGRVGSSAAPIPGSHRGDNSRDALLVHPDALRAKATRDDDVPMVNGEPVRRTLTEPPSGLRRSATGGRVTAQSSGPKVDQQALDANPMNWLRQQFAGESDEE